MPATAMPRACVLSALAIKRAAAAEGAWSRVAVEEIEGMLEAIRECLDGRVLVHAPASDQQARQAWTRVVEEGQGGDLQVLACETLKDAVREAASAFQVEPEDVLAIAPPSVATWAAFATKCATALLCVKNPNEPDNDGSANDDDCGAPTSPLEVLQVFAARAAADAKPPRAVVGVAMDLKRWRALRRARLLPLLPARAPTDDDGNDENQAAVFTPLSLVLAPLAPQLHAVDAVLHKATDKHPLASEADADLDGQYTLSARADLHDACQRVLPSAKLLLDPWPNVCRVTSRARMLRHVQQGGVAVPQWRGPLATAADVADAYASLGFPVLLKADSACGTPHAHDMCAVADASGIPAALRSVPFPCVAMRLAGHGGSFFKCYCIDSASDKDAEVDQMWFHATARPSLPDPEALFRDAGTAAVPFHALKSLPTASPDAMPAPPVAALRAIAVRLASTFGLRLFGFDAILDTASSLLVVDVNYFPSFGGAPGAPSALQRMVRASLRQNLRKRARGV